MTRSRLVFALFTLVTLLARTTAAQSPALVGPFTRDDYPQALIDRPLTLPAGMVEAESGWSFVSQRFDVRWQRLNADGFRVGGSDDWNADLALRVGVTDRIQIEAGTSFSLDHTLRGDAGVQGVSGLDLRPSLTSWQRIVPLRLSLLALDTEAVDTAITLTLPFVASASRTYYFGRGGRIVSRLGDGRVLPAVQLAAPTRWRLTDWCWLRAGENLFQVTTGQGTAAFAFDFGVGIQPHRMIAVTLDSRIASIAFDGDGELASQTLADVGTIDLEGTFSPVAWFDVVGALVLPDVGQGFDDYLTRLAFRVRF